MAVCVELDINNYVLANEEQVINCNGYLLVEAETFNQQIQVDVEIATAAFTFGFGAIFLLASIAYKIRVAKTMIKQA